jgi:hypothetical protein
LVVITAIRNLLFYLKTYTLHLETYSSPEFSSTQVAERELSVFVAPKVEHYTKGWGKERNG